MSKVVDRKEGASPRRVARKAAPREARKGPSIGQQLIESASELLAALESGEPLESRFTVRRYRLAVEPKPYGPDAVRRVRGLLGLSQALFARFIGASAATVRSWEQGARPPSPMACRFLEEIEADPERWRRRIAGMAELEQGGPVRG